MCKKVITSEFVSYGHPDKIADTIADSLLDAYLEQDKNTRAGIEVMVKDNIVVLGGEVNSTATVNYDEIVRNVFKTLPFKANSFTFTAKSARAKLAELLSFAPGLPETMS